MKGQGREIGAKELLAAVERQMIAARETDKTTSDLLHRVARRYAQRALSVLMAERGELQLSLIA